MKTQTTDILILGAGGAGLLAALHARQRAPELSVTIAVKGLLGKCGCTRMVQGGYNVALAEGDSVERHFMDTLEGGQWLNHQEIAWRLVTGARERILELENRFGCLFDRNPDGTVHQKAFAGQTFDRTVHRGDLTGIEIIQRLSEQVWQQDVQCLEEHRAVALIPARSGRALAGLLMIDMRSGEFVLVRARAVLLGTGGGPTMYRYHTPSGDKSCDGMAMALQAGLLLRDMEMVQFHPTGLLAGPGTRMTGTVLEEGLRGAGGHLLNGMEERFMDRYDARGERATRDIVSRAIFTEIEAGRHSPNGGVYLQMKHLGAEKVRREFRGMVKRCADCGFDLAGDRVEVVPTAHYMMGGVVVEPDCRTDLPGLFVAGEDAGGVHGANRLGGNGVANSTVFGGIAGDSMADWVRENGVMEEPDPDRVHDAVTRCEKPFSGPDGDLEEIREALYEVMWAKVGALRRETDLEQAQSELLALDQGLDAAGIGNGTRAFNIAWHDWLNLKSLILVSRSIAAAAILRRESRGAHYRIDHPDTQSSEQTWFTVAGLDDNDITCSWKPVDYSRVRPGKTLLTKGAM